MQRSSSGHKMGQIIGDWFEEYFVLPTLKRVAERLSLFLDSRFIERPGRGEKRILWPDNENNLVDYDFVLELNGTQDIRGIPVGFVECFWRRGARHSKDKARDDSGKLLPMRSQYPTARFLGIVASGDFTGPARELILSRNIDLLYVPKDKIIGAFGEHSLVMDYDDRAEEQEKARISDELESKFDDSTKSRVAASLMKLVGTGAIDSYVHRVQASLSASPQEIRIICQHAYPAIAFERLADVSNFLKKPSFDLSNPTEEYSYQITYSDGYEFERAVESIDEMEELHSQLEALSGHMESIATTS